MSVLWAVFYIIYQLHERFGIIHVLSKNSVHSTAESLIMLQGKNLGFNIWIGIFKYFGCIKCRDFMCHG